MKHCFRERNLVDSNVIGKLKWNLVSSKVVIPKVFARATKPCPSKRFPASLFIACEEITFSGIRHAKNFYWNVGFHRSWTFNLQVRRGLVFPSTLLWELRSNGNRKCSGRFIRDSVDAPAIFQWFRHPIVSKVIFFLCSYFLSWCSFLYSVLGTAGLCLRHSYMSDDNLT